MTREEAIYELKNAAWLGTDHSRARTEEAVEMAISALNSLEEVYAKGYNDGFMQAEVNFENDKALSQESCEDAISRAELLKAISTWDKFGVDDTNSLFRLDNLSLPHYVPYIHYDDVIKCIKGMPSVTQKSGKWVEIDDEPHEVWECDNCGFVIDGSGCIEPYEYRDTYNYCPNCGSYNGGDNNGNE